MHSSPICFLNNKISFIMRFYGHYNGGIHVSGFYLGPSLNIMTKMGSGKMTKSYLLFLINLKLRPK